MHKLLMLATAAALAGCSQERAAEPAVENDMAAADANLAVDNMADVNSAAPATMALASIS